MKWLAGVTFIVCLFAVPKAQAQSPINLSDLQPFIKHLEKLISAGDRSGFLSLLVNSNDSELGFDFVRESLQDRPDRAVVIPRFFNPAEVATQPHELVVEVFTERGDHARLQNWNLQLLPSFNQSADEETHPGLTWRITEITKVGGLDTLHHLRLDPNKQFEAKGLKISAEDMALEMFDGSVFVAEVDTGITDLVLVGKGVFTFNPKPKTERQQVEIFSGVDVLEEEFSHALVRLNPEMITSRIFPSLKREPLVDREAFEEAQELFQEVASMSFAVDLSDLSDRGWWLTPSIGNFLAEVQTDRLGLLTYAELPNQPEDITLYRRSDYKVISLYPSVRQRNAQGNYYDDQQTMYYDVLDYDIVASFDPAGVNQESLNAPSQLEGCWIDGTVRLAIEVTGLNFNSATLQLADDLRVRSVTSHEFGPLMFFRMSGRNNLVVRFPGTIPIGTEFSVIVTYEGLLQAQEPDENWLGRSRHLFDSENMFGIGEPRYIYSGSTAWYPQSLTNDFATATMELSVPADFGVVASGYANESNPPLSPTNNSVEAKTYQFTALQPAKYLSAIISRFSNNDTPSQEVLIDKHASETLEVRSGVVYDRVSLSVETNPRSSSAVSEHYEIARDILGFYGSLVGDIPYPAFTLTLSDSLLPGGHSPAYFAILNRPLPGRPGLIWSWGDDPVAFNETKHFFLAHELAHQWWGQAVGWKNYHEQWLSEALAQYFAALYIQKSQGENEFYSVLSQMRRWSMRFSEKGPVYLGYRLGHIEGDVRVYRALVYNKGALVFHMLRQLVGDKNFFGGLQRYYSEMRFKQAGTNDLIRAFETEVGRSLEQFFDHWIHESELPDIQFSYHTESSRSKQSNQNDVVLNFEQVGAVFELPVVVTIEYRSGSEETTVVRVSNQIDQIRLPLNGRLKQVTIDETDTMLGKIRN